MPIYVCILIGIFMEDSIFARASCMAKQRKKESRPKKHAAKRQVMVSVNLCL